jgi:hypothetical protein
MRRGSDRAVATVLASAAPPLRPIGALPLLALAAGGKIDDDIPF